MPKGYWVAHVDVTDQDAYVTGYIAAAKGTLAAHGAEFLVRGGTRTVAEGAARARTVVIQFPSYQAARDCYNATGYQLAKAKRDPIATGDLVIIEGYDG
jgi:uncharacterized protein (DUF1330 family)